VQGTAEAEPFAREELNSLLDLAVLGCGELAVAQRTALDTVLER
jgi:ribonuclease PH